MEPVTIESLLEENQKLRKNTDFLERRNAQLSAQIDTLKEVYEFAIEKMAGH